MWAKDNRYTIILFVLCTFMTVLNCFPVTKNKTTPSESGYVLVRTGDGVVRGRKIHVDDERDIKLFLGIPYATPPVGSLRFSKPSPVRPWNEVYDALAHGPKCVQTLIPEDPILENVPFSEDCLYLDIYFSSLRNQSFMESKMAVMMYIHGGSFYGGTGAKYNFTNVALKGVLVVSINYRLGVLGFLSTEDDVIPGNFGMLDMVMALDWIKKNIASFGGDPDRITLFGGSSGADSVSLLTLSPLSRGKFQGAIMQSGMSSSVWGFRHPNISIITSLGMAKDLAQELRCPNVTESESFSISLLKYLRQQPAETIIAAQLRIAKRIGMEDFLLWLPVIEDVFGFLPDLPSKLFHDPSFVPIATILGYSKNDGSLLVYDSENDGLSAEEFRTIIHKVVKYFFTTDKSDEYYRRIIKRYFSDSFSSTASRFEIRDRACEFYKDLFFFTPMIRASAMFSEANQEFKSYVYEFDFRPSFTEIPPWMGVGHASEKGYVLDLPQGPDPFKYPNYTEADFEVAEFVSRLWTNFAKYGNPTLTPVNGLIWDPFSSHSKNLSTQCDFSTPRSPFKPNSQYKILKVNTVSEMAFFNQCDTVNFWSTFDQ